MPEITTSLRVPNYAAHPSSGLLSGQVYFNTADNALYLRTASAWTQLGAGGGAPGGATTQVQFNDAGAFGGDAGLAWNKTNKTLNLTGSAAQTLIIDSTTAHIRLRDGAATRYRSDIYLPSGGGGLGINSYDDTAALYMPVSLWGNPVKIYNSAANVATFTATSLNLTPGIGINFHSDLGIGRANSQELEINNTTPGQYGDLRLKKITLGGNSLTPIAISGGSTPVDDFTVRNTVSGHRTIFQVIPNGAVSTLPTAFQFMGTDYFTDPSNFEMLAIYSRGPSDTNYRIFTTAAGSGVRRPLSISADNTDTQMVFSTTGPISVGSSITGSGTVPAGGTTGQQLTKFSNANYDVSWASSGNEVYTGTAAPVPRGDFVIWIDTT